MPSEVTVQQPFSLNPDALAVETFDAAGVPTDPSGLLDHETGCVDPCQEQFLLDNPA